MNWKKSNPKEPPDPTNNTPKKHMKRNWVSIRKGKRDRQYDKNHATRLEHLKNQPTNRQKEVNSANSIDKTNNTCPSFAEVFAITNTLRQTNPIQ
ncbi:hypothetical protein O181_004621 [Austropuccinia psidii MF-1]|uniref:Uncharacterized protein n=1 Tax=Austropuccinia psidii MF-1 TaxID=1389203 RepID=A0A9Q3GF69_9BASI|nr:hypothetical protein [Austropuccinia psidii MF-1]